MKTQLTVKVSSALPADWGVRKSEAMHAKQVATVDKQVARAEERKAARAERKAQRNAA